MSDYTKLVEALRMGADYGVEEESVGKLCADAAAAIEALEAKVPHWVSVEERLPDRYDAYAVGWRYPSGCFYWGKVLFYDGKWQVDEEIPTPDYWMPIEPPQEVQDGTE